MDEAQALIELLEAQGYTQGGEKRNTLREYKEPTIEFYASGAARLRGFNGVSLAHLVYHVDDNGIDINIVSDKETTAYVKKKMGGEANGWHTTNTTKAEDPQLKAAGAFKRWYKIVSEARPQNTRETNAGMVVFDTAEINEAKTKITYNRPE